MLFCYNLQCYWSRMYWTKLGILPQGWNLGLASRIWTYLEPFQGWDQVPNLGPHFEHCFHISTKYVYWVFHRVTPNLLVMSYLFPPLISAFPLILIAHWRLQDEVKTMYWTGWQISCNISSSFSWMRPGRKGVSWFLQLPCNAFWYTPEERHSNWVHTCGLISFSSLGSWYALRLQRCNDTCK